jgi:hypothetical protein
MAGINDNTPLVFHKIGKGIIEDTAGNMYEISKAQSVKVDAKGTVTDVEGGDALFPIYQFLAKRSGTVEITDAVFTTNSFKATNNSTVSTAGNTYLKRVFATLSTTTLGTNLTGVTKVKCIGPAGSPIPVSQSVSATPALDGVYVSTIGDITYGADLIAGEYTFWFDSVVPVSGASTQVSFLKDQIPRVASFRYTIEAEDLDGNSYQVDFYIPRCRANGDVTIDLARSTAATNKMTLTLLDPGSSTDNYMSITYTQLAS